MPFIELLNKVFIKLRQEIICPHSPKCKTQAFKEHARHSQREMINLLSSWIHRDMTQMLKKEFEIYFKGSSLFKQFFEPLISVARKSAIENIWYIGKLYHLRT